MKRSQVRLILFVLVLLMAGWALYHNRIRTSAWLWHLRHKAAVVGDFVISVPGNWYVQSLGGGDQLLVRLDTADRSDTIRVKAHASIAIVQMRRRLSNQDLEWMASLEAAFLEKQGVQPILRKTFNLDDAMIMCVGGGKPGPIGTYDLEPISWRCAASGGLDISFTASEPDMKQIWEIISGIRKKS